MTAILRSVSSAYIRILFTQVDETTSVEGKASRVVRSCHFEMDIVE